MSKSEFSAWIKYGAPKGSDWRIWDTKAITGTPYDGAKCLAKLTGIIHWELHLTNYTVTVVIFYKRLDLIAAALRWRQGEVFFHHDNASFTQTWGEDPEELPKLGIACTGPNTPTPADYYLLRSLSNRLQGRKVGEMEQQKAFFLPQKCRLFLFIPGFL